MIVATLLNKYDFFLVIEGGTGIGKSTLAFHIASKVAQEFRRLYRLNEERIEYYYNWRKNEFNRGGIYCKDPAFKTKQRISIYSY
jgi:hypothetical protein